ncbi:MAG: YraN family protein [Phycisphaerales bacterium]|nr:YraN family protein [Phycisphaerales bacterium]
MARTQAAADLARRGEDAALIFLQQHGYELCAQNLRVGSDEADIVMRAPDGRTLVIVEVKTRSSPTAWPEERIDAAKMRSLVRLARSLERKSLRKGALRIDVIAVNLPPGSAPIIRWFENAVLGN